MTTARLLETAAWLLGAALFGWIVLDAWRTSRRYDERLLLSSREGEIEKDLQEMAADLERIETTLDRERGERP